MKTILFPLVLAGALISSCGVAPEAASSGASTIGKTSEESQKNSAYSLMLGRWKSEKFIFYDFHPDYTYTATWEDGEVAPRKSTWRTEGNKVYWGDAPEPFMTFVDGRPQYYQDGKYFGKIES